MLYIMKRLVVVSVGYVVALVAALVAVVVIYTILSIPPGLPSYFDAISLSPVVILMAPGVGLFAFLVLLVLSVVPALALALLTELFSLRQVWLFALAGAAIAGGCFLYATPTFIGAINGSDWADLGIVIAGGFVGGIFYWLVAGRRAGLSRTIEPVPAG
jgi:hypothetical protein